MHLHLPNSAFLGNIDPFLESFGPSLPSRLEITANPKWISVHPMVLSMVAALGMKLKPSAIHCHKLEATSRHYLQRMGLFTLLGIDSGMKITEHDSTGRFIPLTNITNSKELTTFITEMIPLLHLEPQQAAPIKYVVSELVRNVLEHAQSPRGAIVSAQFYKKSNTIRLGVADTGIGIKTSITQAHPAATDLEALQLALTPGITGTTRKEGGTEFNAGAGLFVIKSLAKVNRDFFVIYSGKALYKLLKSNPKRKEIHLYADPLKDRHSVRENLPFWQGTVVGIDLSLEVTQEFTTLLDLIWGAYLKTIKERKKERYHRARFI